VGSTAAHTNRITFLHWDSNGKRLFSGDAAGHVVMTDIKKSQPSGFSSLFDKDKLVWMLDGQPRVICSTDSRVVQLDAHQKNLLISSLSKVLVLNLEKLAEPPKQVTPVPFSFLRICRVSDDSSVQVGKALRQGSYGVCFDSSSDGNRIFAARPGKRIWSASSATAEVLSTLKLTFPEPPSRFSPFSDTDCGT
jgi:hypothetical protein